METAAVFRSGFLVDLIFRLVADHLQILCPKKVPDTFFGRKRPETVVVA